jgi:hypothetical protein
MVAAGDPSHDALFVGPVLDNDFSITTLMADRLASDGNLHVQYAAWYRKRYPTFSDALVVVRLHLRKSGTFLRLEARTETMKIPTVLYHHLLNAIAYVT